MSAPLRIGLTGGIASGKSVVSSQFASYGVPIIDSDLIAREVIAPGTALFQEVLRRFAPLARARYGGELQREGTLDRALLRRLIFDDPALRRELEYLLHPAIRARAEAQAAAAHGPYQMHVVPLLIETAAKPNFDRVLVVDCPETQRMARLIARDRVSPEQARAMLAAQADREARLAMADDVIDNSGDRAALQAQVASLHAKYLALARQRQP